MATNKLMGRSNELKTLKEFAASKKSGLVCIRGRRRVGKSALLRELERTSSGIFYFFGTPDSTTPGLIAEFARNWDTYTGRVRLTELKSLGWSRVFSEISDHVGLKKTNLVLIFDEIQWIAKTKSGCLGALKNAWQTWEHLGIKVILCGSSNRFFLKKTAGEAAVLRGLKTRSDIWIQPFSLGEVQRYYFSKWKNEEVALTYMMLGGIPYYLNQIENRERGFIHSINQAVFTNTGIFLEEVDEVLRLEFKEHGLKTAKIILGTLGQDGKTQAEIQKTTGLPLTTVVHALENLTDYGILFQKTPAHGKRLNDAGLRYFIKDFYLNFFFQVLRPTEAKIRNNTAGLLFPQVFQNNNNGYYIPDFSGKAFELLIRSILERKSAPDPKIYPLLLLIDNEFDVLDYWDKTIQIDLLVEHHKDRISRVIECKWINSNNNESLQYINAILSKEYKPPGSYIVKHYLIISKAPSVKLSAQAEKAGVKVIGLEALF